METGIHELTAGYALDALDEDERSAYERTSRTASTAGRSSRRSGRRPRHWPSPLPGPSQAWRCASASSRTSARAAERRGVRAATIARRARSRAVAAVAAVVALGIGLWASNLSSELDETRAALARAGSGAAAGGPGAQTVALQQGTGRLVVDVDGQAVLVVEGLEPAPAGKTYELWIVPGGDIAASPAGLFPGSDGTEVVASMAP